MRSNLGGGRMPGTYRAVLIGVDVCPREEMVGTLDYAEVDARAMSDLLTDLDIGTFEPGNVQLLTGSAATASNIKTALRSAAETMEPADFLLVFFAGHAVLDTRATPYLAAHDLDLAAIRANPDVGLRMSFLRNDVFDYAQGSSLLLLDCCDAGRYLDGAEAVSSDRLQRAVDASYMNQLARHSAMVGCPAGKQARESSELKHGVFTFHLLEGLRSKAARHGPVRIADLCAYLTSLDIDPPLGLSLHGWDRKIVLTQSVGRVAAPAERSAAPRAEVTPLLHPLAEVLAPMRMLMKRLFRDERTRIFRTEDRLERLRSALDATATVIVDLSLDAASKVDASSTFGASTAFDRDLLKELLPTLSHQLVPSDRGALAHVWDRPDMRVLAVPLKYLPGRVIRTLLVFDPPSPSLAIGEPLGYLLAASWREDQDTDPRLAELNVVTGLRAEFGRVPHNFYLECFQLYKDQLDLISMAFEPIVEIGPTAANVSIYGWEALARTDASARRAPVSILRAAETWGTEFVVERDRVLAERAINSYRDAHRPGTGNDSIRPLSINVAVPALLSDLYTDAVGRHTRREPRQEQGHAGDLRA